MSLTAGTRLGPYEILDRLGAGGMGEVFRARDTRLDRAVAVKVIRAEFAADADRITRFEKEARAAARLDHPNVLVVHDVGMHEGVPYIVSELLEGAPLRARLGEALAPRAAVGLAAQIAHGLAAAHEKGIVHRDLKPENVFVRTDGRVKILDFGLAKLVQPAVERASDTQATTAVATEPGALLGTVGYMSPEQVLGSPLDARSDVFSLGVVLYELLSGRRPFRGDSVPETLTAILRSEPPDLAEANRNVPPALERIVRRCLEKDPARRFGNGREVAAELDALAGTLDTKPAVPMSAAGVFVRRHRAAVAAAAVIAALAAGAGLWWARAGNRGGLGRSLAVLPFENLTGDAEQAYLADGIHESLITDLARLSGFTRVIARPSVAAFRKIEQPLSEIGRKLGVDTLVTGSVLRAAGKLRVTAHLIDARTEEQVWSESYERAPRDVLSLQSEIVRAIAAKVKLTLTPAERARLAAARPVSPEAYEAYLKGKFQLNKMTPEGFEKSIAHLNEAVRLDPASPKPHAALAVAYSQIGHERFPDAFERARAAVTRAEVLAGGDPPAEMYHALGMLKLYSDWDYEGSAKDFRRAIELDPSLGAAHRDYSWYQNLTGHRSEALAEMKRALELDPLSPLFVSDRAWQLWWDGRHDEAMSDVKNCLDLDPNFNVGLAVLGFVHADRGRYAEAVAAHEKLATADPGWKWCLPRTLVRAGRTKEAREKLAAFLREGPGPPGELAPWFLAEAYAALGETDEAIRWLNQAHQSRFSWMPWIAANPGFAPLRSDPRFQDLVRRVNPPKG